MLFSSQRLSSAVAVALALVGVAIATGSSAQSREGLDAQGPDLLDAISEPVAAVDAPPGSHRPLTVYAALDEAGREAIRRRRAHPLPAIGQHASDALSLAERITLATAHRLRGEHAAAARHYRYVVAERDTPANRYFYAEALEALGRHRQAELVRGGYREEIPAGGGG